MVISGSGPNLSNVLIALSTALVFPIQICSIIAPIQVVVFSHLTRSSGSMGASPTSLVVNSAARISSVCSSIPMWILRHTRRLAPPCLRVRRENSPPDCFLILLSTVVGLAAAFTGGRSLPDHGGIKPDRQRAAALERFVVGGSVPGLVGGACGSAHALQLPHWIHKVNPLWDLCNRAPATDIGLLHAGRNSGSSARSGLNADGEGFACSMASRCLLFGQNSKTGETSR